MIDDSRFSVFGFRFSILMVAKRLLSTHFIWTFGRDIRIPKEDEKIDYLLRTKGELRLFAPNPSYPK
jgi:hypothetical protein